MLITDNNRVIKKEDRFCKDKSELTSERNL